MRRWSMPWFVAFVVVLLLLVDGAQAASTVTLSVEGMT